MDHRLRRRFRFDLIDNAALSKASRESPVPAVVVRLHRRSRVRLCLYWLLCLVTCGLLAVVVLWWPRVYTRMTTVAVSAVMDGDDESEDDSEDVQGKASSSPSTPDHVEFIKGHRGRPRVRLLAAVHDPTSPGDSYLECPVYRLMSLRDAASSTDKSSSLKCKSAEHQGPHWYFDYRKQRYLWDGQRRQFRPCLFRYRPLRREVMDMESLLFKSSHTATATTSATAVDAHGYGPSDAVELARLTSLQTSRPDEPKHPNMIDIEPVSIVRMFLYKLFHPFYLFQLFSASIWFWQQYTSYAAIIVGLSTVSICSEIYNAVANTWKLRSMVRQGADFTVPVRREGRPIHVHADDLLVGDLVELKADMRIPCDMLLLNASAILNESSLTGESTPTVKAPLMTSRTGQPDDPLVYESSECKQHVLLGGTQLLQVKAVATPRLSGTESAWGLVVGTGFSTLKGQLFRSILYPKKIDFQFYRDAKRFLTLLGAVAIAAYIKRVVDGLNTNTSVPNIIMSSFDLVTIAVPPALPLILTVGIGFAVRRLSKGGIFCIDPERVNFAGRVNVFCFDKTGTLTQPDMDFCGVVPVQSAVFGTPVWVTPRRSMDVQSVHNVLNSAVIPVEEAIQLPQESPLFSLMVSCHNLMTLKVLDDNGSMAGQLSSDEIVGNHVDLEMFRSTCWKLTDAPTNAGSILRVVRGASQYQRSNSVSSNGAKSFTATVDFIDIMHRFEFTPFLQRSAVVAKRTFNDGRTDAFAFVKGSAESILSICDPASVPPNYEESARKWSSASSGSDKCGYYVIACAYRAVTNVETIKSREQVEQNLTFCGFIFLRNEIKPESASVIRHLRQGQVTVKMITGDHLATAIRVSKELGILAEGNQRAARSVSRSSQPVMVQRHSHETDIVPSSIITDDAPIDRPSISGSDAPSLLTICWDENTNEVYGIVADRSDRISAEKLFESAATYRAVASESHLYPRFVHSRGGRGHHAELATSPFGVKPELVTTGQVLRKIYDLASNGKSLQHNVYQFLFDWIIKDGVVFARVQPDEKTLLVEQMILQGSVVAMCGDGTNDCGALKAAHVGLSLSTAEASIVSPFTSTRRQITDAVELVREGRCALATSFLGFRYMMLYPLIQLMMAASLNHMGAYLGNNQFLMDDLLIVLLLSLTMLYTGPARHLSREPPNDDLFGWPVLGSILPQIGLCIGFYAWTLALLFQQPWYCSARSVYEQLTLDSETQTVFKTTCFTIDISDIQQFQQGLLIYSHETNVAWLFCHFQFLITGFVFNLTQERFPDYLGCYGRRGSNQRNEDHVKVRSRRSKRSGILSWCPCASAGSDDATAAAFRRPFYTNLYFVSTCVFLFIWLSYLLLAGNQSAGVSQAFSLISRANPEPMGRSSPLASDFLRWLWGIMTLQFLVAIVWEKWLVSLTGYYGRRLWMALTRLHHRHTGYRKSD